MDTKEAIKWVFDIWHEWENVYGFDSEQNLKEGKKLEEVIELLKRGEKFEAIVKGFKNIFYANPHNWVTKEYYADEIKNLEQKYFPKPSKDFTEKVMEKIKEEEDG